MGNSTTMFRKNASKFSEEQTSTPLRENKGDLLSKSFGNLSSIINECQRLSNLYLESEAILSAKNSPITTDRYHKFSVPSKKINKRRCDTPLNAKRNSRVPYASSVFPLKQMFSRISSPFNLNSKPTTIVRRCSKTDNEQLLCNVKKRNKCKKEKYGSQKLFGSEFCGNMDYFNRNDISSAKSCPKEAVKDVNVSFSKSVRNEFLSEEGCIVRHEVYQSTYSTSFESSESITHATGSDFLSISDTVESCRRESTNSTASNIVGHFSDLALPSSSPICSSPIFNSLLELNISFDKARIATENVVHGLGEKSKEIFEDFFPSEHILEGFDFLANEKDEEKGKCSDKDSINEIGIEKLEHPEVKEVEDRQKSILVNSSIEKASIFRNTNLDEHLQANFDEKRKNMPATLVKRKLKSVKDMNKKKKEKIMSKIESKNVKKKKQISKNSEEYREKAGAISQNLENEEKLLNENQQDRSNRSQKSVAEVVKDSEETYINENFNKKEKETASKFSDKLGTRQEQEIGNYKYKSKSSVENVANNFGDFLCSRDEQSSDVIEITSNRKETRNGEIFRKQEKVPMIKFINKLEKREQQETKIDANNSKNHIEDEEQRFNDFACRGNEKNSDVIEITDGINDGKKDKNSSKNRKASPARDKTAESPVEKMSQNLNDFPYRTNPRKLNSDEVEVFKKPLPVKQYSISKQSASNDKGKTERPAYYLLTSTPLDSPANRTGKLPLHFKFMSPVIGSPEKLNESWSFGNIKKHRTKTKKTCAKSVKNYPKSGKKTSKRDSFSKKSTYQKESIDSSNRVSNSKSNDVIGLSKSMSTWTIENVPLDDILILWNKYGRSKASRKMSEQIRKQLRRVERAKNVKKKFEKSKLKKLTDRLNRISEVPLTVEKKKKKKKRFEG